MALKENILKELEENKNEFISGQELAEKFSVSRSAIWKAINTLKNDGYKIKAVTNKGYFLEDNDIVSKEGISVYLNNKDYSIITLKTVDSTNSYAKRLIAEKSLNNTVIISEEQTAGRGRLGRKFYSPGNNGIYMSVIKKVQKSPEDLTLFTVKTAVAVSKAIDEVCKIETGIKWVNDIYYKNKKICGILTEAISDFETGLIDSIVIGIGINIKSTEDFPMELKEIAGAINLSSPVRNKLIASILDKMYNILYDDTLSLDYYKNKSIVLGKEIIYYKNQKEYKGYAKDINSKGNLIIINPDGTEDIIHSGEIKIKMH